MMLILKKENPCEDISIDIDGYIPFTVEVKSQGSSAPPLYFRGGDGKQSLIEIGLNRGSGSVCNATLTAISPERVSETELPANNDLPEIIGLAAFDVSTWDSCSDNYADNFDDSFDSEITLMVGANYLSLHFEGIEEPVRYIKNNQLRFGITSDGKLSTLELLELTEDQVNLLKPV
ncbi:hypothetical protein [Agarilytica rhodophyticola]|uniref:hypothetical protein n=1 Tax=Agarilytica rhodophyticola TaxID=1737490 RepID=UPI000B34156C|nr:hypothetical protein [Agarilytica rhodophyticola]